MKRTWKMWAHETEHNPPYMHIGPKRYVELHGLKQYPIVEVELEENEIGPYWGWLEAGGTIPYMIWPSLATFSCCFPYGTEVEEERGLGKVLRLAIRKV